MVELFQNGGPMGIFLGFALLFIAVEYLIILLSHHDHSHDAQETAASIGVALGDLVVRFATAGLVTIPFLLLYNKRLFDIPTGNPLSWLVLFLGAEFCYYWFHRLSHEIRWFWASHAVHHSATHFNLSAAIRLGWTGQLTGAFLFFLPLAWIGFHPFAIAAVLGAGLLYQFFLHTAFPVKLGILERVFNTPRHHRVHHAANDECLDKNYGAVLIIFDRLFGTYAEVADDKQLIFGLKGRAVSNNPVRIALGEWQHLFSDVQKANGLRGKLAVLFGRP